MDLRGLVARGIDGGQTVERVERELLAAMPELSEERHAVLCGSTRATWSRRSGNTVLAEVGSSTRRAVLHGAVERASEWGPSGDLCLSL